jgi:hypothetical protein
MLETQYLLRPNNMRLTANSLFRADHTCYTEASGVFRIYHIQENIWNQLYKQQIMLNCFKEHQQLARRPSIQKSNLIFSIQLYGLNIRIVRKIIARA